MRQLSQVLRFGMLLERLNVPFETFGFPKHVRRIPNVPPACHAFMTQPRSHSLLSGSDQFSQVTFLFTFHSKSDRNAQFALAIRLYWGSSRSP